VIDCRKEINVWEGATPTWSKYKQLYKAEAWPGPYGKREADAVKADDIRRLPWKKHPASLFPSAFLLAGNEQLANLLL